MARNPETTASAQKAVDWMTNVGGAAVVNHVPDPQPPASIVAATR